MCCNIIIYSYNIRLYIPCIVHVLMRDEKEGRKKQARLNKQQLRQRNTAHPRQSRKMSHHMYIVIAFMHV